MEGEAQKGSQKKAREVSCCRTFFFSGTKILGGLVAGILA